MTVQLIRRGITVTPKNEAHLHRLLRAGYVRVPEERPLGKMTVGELRELAKERKFDTTGMSKPELVALLEG